MSRFTAAVPRWAFPLLLSLILVMPTVPLLAQEVTASISGTVTAPPARWFPAPILR